MGSVFYNTPQRLKSVRDPVPEVAELQTSIDSGVGMGGLDFFQESFGCFDALVFIFLVKINGIAPIHTDRPTVGKRILVHCIYPL